MYAYDMALEGKDVQHVFTLNYPVFLPKSNFLRFIARFGNKSIRYLYWKNGFLFFHNNNIVLAECITDSKERAIKISVDNKNRTTAKELFDSLVEIDDAEDLEVSVNRIHFVQVKKIAQKIKENRQEIDTASLETLNTEDFHFLFKTDNPSSPPKDKDMNKEVKIFISYSSKDRDLRQLLVDGIKDHLTHTPGFNFIFWTDKQIDIGDNWKEEIDDAIKSSDIALLLVSASFASSKYIQQVELAEFFNRKQAENYLILPVLVRNYEFTHFETLSNLQFFKTYYSSYGFKKPIDRNKLLPFDVLAEDEHSTDKQLQDYYKYLADAIYNVVKNRFNKIV
jgi:hypothetical protein